MGEASNDRSPLPSVGEDLAAAELEPKTPQTRSPSYLLAFADGASLLRPDRLQLEQLKPEMLLTEASDPQHRGGVRQRLHPGAGNGGGPDPQAGLRTRPGAHLRGSARVRASGLARRPEAWAGTPLRDRDRRRAGRDGGRKPWGSRRGRREHRAQHRAAARAGPEPYITPELCFQFHYFAIHKLHFVLRARALVFFPGGYGTLDELFEALNLVQTGKAERMPILLFDEKYWRRIVNFEAMAEEGVIAPRDLDLFRYGESPEAAWRAICAHYDLDPALAYKGS
jgi:hypothetical protein